VLVDYRVRQREYLLSISRALTSELDLADVLRIIVQASVDFISGRAGIVVLTAPDTQGFRAAAVYGIERSRFEALAVRLRDLTYELGQERETLSVMNHQVLDMAKKADLGVTQMLRLPLSIGEEFVGMIYVFQTSSYHLGREAQSLLQSFAGQAAIAVKNARLYQELNSQKQRLDAILDQSADGIMILDSGLRITRFNRNLSRMTGLGAEQAIGEEHSAIIRLESLRTERDLASAVAGGWPLDGDSTLYVEGQLAREPEEPISIGITYAPLRNEEGQMTSVIANVRDLTRHRQEEDLQKTFISVVSHELKTPVSIIKGYAGTLKRRDVSWGREVQDEYLEVIEEEADRLTELIDSLLEASRLQSGTFALDISEGVNLAAVVRSSVRKFETQTDIHTFNVVIAEDFPTVSADERRITNVVDNLLSNAIKYSPGGCCIDAIGEVTAHHATISVRDRGIGIPEEQRDRVFQKFSRLDNDLSRISEGTGLGLFLSKAIIEAHQGRIWISDSTAAAKHPGRGTTISFSLPLDGA